MQESSSSSNDDQKSDAPLHRIILCLDPPSAPPPTKEDGVPVPPLLQHLFGIDFLPRPAALLERPQHEHDHETESIHSEPSLEATLEEGQQEAEHDDMTPQSADAIHSSSFERKKMRVSVGTTLAARVANARQKRKHRRHGVGGDTEDSLKESKDRSPRKSSARPKFNASWIQKQQARLEQHKSSLSSVQQETLLVEARARALSTHLQQAQEQVAELEQALSRSIIELENDNRELQLTKKELKRLEAERKRSARGLQETASTIRNLSSNSHLLDDDSDPLSATNGNLDALSLHSEPNLPHNAPALAAPTPLHKVASFIRVHDLDMGENSNSSVSDVSLGTCCEDLFYIDNDVTTVLTALAQFGHTLATDEGERFTPVLHTEIFLSHSNSIVGEQQPDPSWPIQPWHAAVGKRILVWTGTVGHNGHGCELPMIKARGIIPTAPRNVVDLLMDSSRVGEYNKMSQGRRDVLYLQKGIDTTADESEYGIPGEAKIIKSLNKPPLIRRKIEMLSLIYARKLKEVDGYLLVSRSVWEDSNGTSRPELLEKDTVRSEILLGVNIFRPVVGGGGGPDDEGTTYCEMTTITHTHTSGVVPDALLRKMGPGQAAKFMEEIQSIFSKH
jgi:hypothetical protein